MFKRRQRWVLGLSTVLLLVASVQLAGLNSLEYRVNRQNGRLDLALLDKRISVNDLAPDSPISIDFFSQPRFSSGQFLLAGKVNWFTGIQFWNELLFTRKAQNRPAIILQPHQQINLIHFNPFRAGVRLANLNVSDVRIEINVPDASFEVWQGPAVVDSGPVKIPWLRLTLYPTLSLLALAGAIVSASQLVTRPKLEHHDA